MNKEQAKAWLPLIQAIAEGKTLQELNGDKWVDLSGRGLRLSLDTSFFRIKPEPKKEWFRVALIKGRDGCFLTLTADSEEVHSDPESFLINEWEKDFVRWLTDRIEYELPEGEA